MSNIKILPATLDDFHQLALLSYHGFSGTPVNLLMFGGQSFEKQVANTKEYLRKALDDPTCKLTKAVVDGQTVAFSQWHYYVEPMALEDEMPSNWGEGANGALCDAFFGTMKKVRKEHMGGKRCAVLAILVTDPASQGRGVGSLLCNDGLRVADQMKLPAWLEASAKGRKLYQKLGFEDVGDIVIDLSKYGGEGVATTVCMLRQAKLSEVTEPAR